MQKTYIQAVGAYLPALRLDRKAAAAALRWSGANLPREGRRAVAAWDEDALTLALEAARLPDSPSDLDVVFASTSAPFFERSHAALIVEALARPRLTRSHDVSGSRRCAASALLTALQTNRPTLIAAGEHRPTQPGSSAQLSFGDGGAAVIVGAAGGALYLGGASLAHDLTDTFSSREHPHPYPAEERFVRDVASLQIIAPAIAAACADAGVEPASISHAAVIEPVAGCYKLVASKLGMNAPNHAAELTAAAGDLGAAHPLFALALAFDRAKAGDVVLLAAFGSGCDAILFRIESAVAGAELAAAAMREGIVLDDYVRFLNLTDALDFDWGPRAEIEQKAQASVLARSGRDMIGFIGGRDRRGNVQFPKSRVPVSAEADGPEPMEDVRLADEPARIVSITADRLNYIPDPPFRFGLVQFANGARVMMEFVDIDGAGLKVGDPVRMRLRVKSFERRRGFRTYFWKAAPLLRPSLEA